MKLKLFYLFVALLGVGSFMGCSDDDSDDVRPAAVPQVVTKNFATKYADAKNVKWEKSGIYYKAEFVTVPVAVERDAWYSADGTWRMTENDYGRNFFLTEPGVNAAFNQTEYSGWTVDDIALYEYPDETKNVYIIEVEQAGQPDTDLIFKAADYSFVKAVPNMADITPDTPVL